MATQIQELEKGDRILFNDRSVPLTVEKVEESEIEVEGPQGGEYEIYEAEDTDDLLVSKKGERRYSSYCRELRKVGKWEKNNSGWKHSNTGARIELEQLETGYWTLKTDLEVETEVPKYGFSKREFAAEEAEKLVREHPEGK